MSLVRDTYHQILSQYKNQNAKTHKFKILDIQKSIAQYEYGDTSVVNASLYKNLKVQLDKIRNILGKEVK